MVNQYSEILKDCRTYCQKYGIRLHIEPYKRVSGLGEQSGYFEQYTNGSKPLLVVQKNTEGKLDLDCILVLLHEWSHAEQWVADPTYPEFVDHVSYWVEGKTAVPVDSALCQLIECEIDAERRTIQKMIRYGLHRHKAIEDYAQEVNAYFASYLVAVRQFAWVDEVPKYLVRLFPKVLYKSFDEVYNGGWSSLDWGLVD